MTPNNIHFLIFWGGTAVAVTVMAVSWHWSQVRTARYNALGRQSREATAESAAEERERCHDV